MAANLDPEKWFGRPEDSYSTSLKATAIAWWRYHGMVEAHKEDAMAEKMRKARK